MWLLSDSVWLLLLCLIWCLGIIYISLLLILSFLMVFLLMINTHCPWNSPFLLKGMTGYRRMVVAHICRPIHAVEDKLCNGVLPSVAWCCLSQIDVVAQLMTRCHIISAYEILRWIVVSPCIG